MYLSYKKGVTRTSEGYLRVVTNGRVFKTKGGARPPGDARDVG